jgi:hypothetical protein
MLSGFSFNSLAKDGGSCDFAEEEVLVQIKTTNEDEHVISTFGNKSNLEPSTPERLFYISTNQAKEITSKLDYLIATIKHTTSGACPPGKVIHIKKLIIGKLQLQIDEKLYYGGAFRFNEVQNCIGKKMPLCKALQLPKYNDTQIKTIHGISAKTLKTCSLNAIRVNIHKLDSISETAYSLGCAINKKTKKEFPLYFEMINERLEFRGVLF